MMLPYPPLADALPGQGSYVVTQGPNTCGSHCSSDPYNAWAYDFGMSTDQVVAAAHTGTVYDHYQDGNIGGRCLQSDDVYANYVVLQHNIETSKSTLYLHLEQGSETQYAITNGLFVYQGHPLGRSGNTGYTCPIGDGDHLHFALRSGLATADITIEVWFDDASVAGYAGRPPANGVSFASSNRPKYSAQYLGGTRWQTLSPGTVTSEVGQWKNTGWWLWFSGGANPTRLGTYAPTPGQDQSSLLGGGPGCSVATDWLSCNRIAVSTVQVDPDQTGWFPFQMRAPGSSGTYDLYLVPVTDGIQWMQPEGAFWRVVVP